MAEIQITDLEKLLQEAELEGILALAKQKQYPPTLIEITGYQTKENFYNNILAFFLRTDAAHGMGDLVVSSLLEAVDIETDDVNVSNVVREYTTYTTDKRKRIDLLIETRRYIIGIENKIYAWAYNDFEEYSKTINTLAKKDSGSSDERKPVCILLSLFKQEKHEDFIPITYKEFFEKIEKNLGKYTTDAHPEYLQFLLHFIKTIRNLTMKNELDQEMKKEMKKFLEKEDNAEKAEFFYEKCREYKATLDTSLFSEENLNHFNKDKSPEINTRIWKNQVFVIDCKYDEQLPTFSIDMWTCFPYHAGGRIFFRKNGYVEHIKNFIEKYKLLEYFKRDEPSIENFYLKDPIPIDEITKDDNVLGRLVNALIEEHKTMING